MLVKFSQIHIFLTLLKCLTVPYPSMFTNVCINYYAHAPCDGKIAKNPSAYWNHLKIHIYTANMFYQQTCQCVCSNADMSDMIFFKLHISKIIVPYIRLTEARSLYCTSSATGFINACRRWRAVGLSTNHSAWTENREETCAFLTHRCKWLMVQSQLRTIIAPIPSLSDHNAFLMDQHLQSSKISQLRPTVSTTQLEQTPTHVHTDQHDCWIAAGSRSRDCPFPVRRRRHFSEEHLKNGLSRTS